VIEFVSYTGKFPNLCSGILAVRVDGCEYRFGYGLHEEDVKGPLLPQFWTSGGGCGFTDDWDENVTSGPWEMCLSPSEKESYPPEIRDMLPEILAVMNENVPHGCCGGCI
jgi:hypothetical protein